MKIWRYLLVGIGVFIGLAIFLTPASLLNRYIEQVPDVEVTELYGTIWNGSGRLSYRKVDLGQVDWGFKPSSLLRLAIGYNLRIRAPFHDIRVVVEAALDGRTTATADGTASAPSINAILRAYFIEMEGEVVLNGVFAELNSERRIVYLDGDVRWSGGTVEYRVAGNYDETTLPPMVAYLNTEQGEPMLAAYVEDDDVALLLVRLDKDGWANIGITKKFTRLTGRSWPGSEPDHTVVLEVSEKLL